jgi:nucleoside-diphosphate-sugar epimerase
VGFGEDVPIGKLAALVQEVVGYEGRIVFDSSKPDGTPRKLLDVSRLHALGWKPKVPLRRGIEETYAWYLTSGFAATRETERTSGTLAHAVEDGE